MIGQLALVALLVVPASSAPNDRAAVAATVTSYVDDERNVLCEDATLELLNEPKSDPMRKRRWRDVPNSGVGFSSRLLRKTTAIVGDRAQVDLATSSRVYYGEEFSGITYTIWDQLELRRVDGNWCVGSVARATRQRGTDADWHRRHP